MKLQNKIYTVDRISQCKNVPNEPPIDFSNITKVHVKHGIQLAGSILVRKDLASVIGVGIFASHDLQNITFLSMQCQLDVTRCKGTDCDTFANDTMLNFCKYMDHNLYVGDVFSRSTTPYFLCPLRSGKYVIKNNAIIDMRPISLLPFDSWNKWMLTFYFFENVGEFSLKGTFIGCIYAELRSTHSRNGRKRT